MSLGNKIKKLRKEKHWSQLELAEKLEVHVTHISRLETDRYNPSLELLKKLAELFEVTTDYLLYENSLNTGPINLKDKSLYEKIKLIDELEDSDKAILNGVIDAFITKRQMWRVLNKPLANIS